MNSSLLRLLTSPVMVGCMGFFVILLFGLLVVRMKINRFKREENFRGAPETEIDFALRPSRGGARLVIVDKDDDGGETGSAILATRKKRGRRR